QERIDGSLDRLDLVVVEGPEALCEPRRPARPHPAEKSRPGRRHAQCDAPAILVRASPFEEAGVLEPVDMAGQRRGGDALDRGELAESEPRVLAYQPEQRRLAARDTERFGLTAQLAGEAEKNRPQTFCSCRSVDSLANH